MVQAHGPILRQELCQVCDQIRPRCDPFNQTIQVSLRKPNLRDHTWHRNMLFTQISHRIHQPIIVKREFYVMPSFFQVIGENRFSIGHAGNLRRLDQKIIPNSGVSHLQQLLFDNKSNHWGSTRPGQSASETQAALQKSDHSGLSGTKC
jgi:hypothetical protein